MINVIIPYKDRIIDTDNVVYVYRNLNKKGKWYSIKQNNLVVAHTTKLHMYNCHFIVHNSGKQRAIQTKVRNVHALIKGYISDKMATYDTEVKYYPFNNLGFTIANTDNEIECSTYVKVNENGIMVKIN